MKGTRIEPSFSPCDVAPIDVPRKFPLNDYYFSENHPTRLLTVGLGSFDSRHQLPVEVFGDQIQELLYRQLGLEVTRYIETRRKAEEDPLTFRATITGEMGDRTTVTDTPGAPSFVGENRRLTKELVPFV